MTVTDSRKPFEERTEGIHELAVPDVLLDDASAETENPLPDRTNHIPHHPVISYPMAAVAILLGILCSPIILWTHWKTQRYHYHRQKALGMTQPGRGYIAKLYRWRDATLRGLR